MLHLQTVFTIATYIFCKDNKKYPKVMNKNILAEKLTTSHSLKSFHSEKAAGILPDGHH